MSPFAALGLFTVVCRAKICEKFVIIKIRRFDFRENYLQKALNAVIIQIIID